MADEEALHVVVGVDEPAGDALGTVAAHFAGVGVEDVHTVDFYLEHAVAGVQDVDVRLAEDDEKVALAGVLQIVGHVQVGVHARLQHRNAAEFGEVGGMGVVIEGAGDEHIEARIAGLARGRHQVGAGDGAELRTDEDSRALLDARLLVAFQIAAFGADIFAGPGGERGEDDLVLFVRLLHAGGLQIFEDHLGRSPALRRSRAPDPPCRRSIRHFHPRPARGAATDFPR